jgi:hypothetical protein
MKPIPGPDITRLGILYINNNVDYILSRFELPPGYILCAICFVEHRQNMNYEILGLHEKILLIERLRENSAEKLRIAVLKYV